MTTTVLPVQRDLAGLFRAALERAVASGALDLDPAAIPEPALERPRLPEHGDWATNVAMVLARAAKAPPRMVAEAMVAHLELPDWVAGVEVAGPGFVNVRLDQSWFAGLVRRILAAGQSFGTIDLGHGERVNVEFISANPTGPLHVGNARLAPTGDALANLLAATGHKVEREYYFNDAGSQIEQLGASVEAAYLQLVGRPFELPADGYRGAYVAEAAAELLAEQGDQQAVPPAVQQRVDELQADVPLSFDLVEIAEGRTVTDDSSGANPFDWTAARWIFLAFALAFAVKVPLFPLHTWLPDAHTEAPTAGSVILAGVLLKLGIYGLLRFGLYLFPDAASFFAPALVTLGVIGIVYGAIVATMQRDLKRLVAYSSVAHLGFIVLGIFAITTQGLQGGLIQSVNHGLSTGALFLLVGMISERRHTREIVALKGLQKAAPIFAAVFTVVMMSSIGLPGLNGFVGEFLVLIGSFLTRRWWTVVAATGVILAALYLLWAYQRVFHGEPDDDNRHFPEINWREGLVMAPLLGLIVFLGIYPKPVLERMQPSVDRLIDHVEANSDYTEPPVATEGPLVTAGDEARDEEAGG